MSIEIGLKNPNSQLAELNLENTARVYWNLKPNQLIEETLHRGQGTLTQNGTLSIKTGKFTGRSPKDRFIVEDEFTKHTVDWNSINQAISVDSFEKLYNDIISYLNHKDVFIKDASLCRDPEYNLKVRVVTEYPWSAQFVHNMFIRLDNEEIINFNHDWLIYCIPGFKANPEFHGTAAANFSIINFTKKTVIIGGSAYTGEIKKAMFSVLNYCLPLEANVLSMHCSANVGKNGDSAVFFGLSGTGKTTLSADPSRKLIGDDEHGWSEKGLFNFEGGCYAKCVNLNPVTEPDIYNAIKPGAILENIVFHKGTSRPNYEDTSITENTRVSYPIHHINNLYPNDLANHPNNIFFLSCDAFGILPPLSKLTPDQAMFYFMSGYTAKVAGTEEGVLEPKATFSACFGAPFLPLHPNEYASLLGKLIEKYQVNIWLVNTGWVGGAYGEGQRIPLKYTRRLIEAALNGELEDVSFTNFAVFDFQIPSYCSDIPGDILHPRNAWIDKEAYNAKRLELAELFIHNFEKFGNSKVNDNILNAAPKVLATID